MFHATAGYIAGGLALIAYGPLVVATIKRKARPNLATWLIWTISDILVVISYFAVGARDTLWVPIGFTIGAVVVAILAITHGENKFGWLEISCFIAACLSLIAWALTKAPLAALLINILIAGLGGLPTAKKTLLDPKSENAAAWILFSLSSIVNLLAIETWKFEIAVFPVAIFFFDTAICLLVVWPRKNITVPT